jgi:crotonobetainyl-CoA:carnitine CoA-transferase CaiB-like acyl-CoA transferase
MTSLSVLRVLDLSEGVAGAFCTKLLAGFGAEVIKIERPGAGDPLRRYGPFPDDLPHPEKSALFLYLNTGKKSVTLDIAQRSGALIFRRMAEEAEVVVESFAPGYLAELGLDYGSLARIKPRLVMTSVTPFGQDGPFEPDREPLKNGGYQAEYQAGLHAFAATATVAFSADATEVGQHIDIAIMECLVSMLEPAGNIEVEGATSAPAHTVQDLLETRGFFQEIEHPAAGRLTYPGPPFRLEAMPWQAARAPLLGEHNEQVYCGELGLSHEELATLRASGVV